ncbi:unnamed protein product [Echinostoma caproni]|uniref:Dynamin_M domain-containing protein n=1 Tax=Echinostoma caproni TaxID=27848 RepID=A0A183AXE7_9TREM|nr:unnamed protein product [Echinostoma caproni]
MDNTFHGKRLEPNALDSRQSLSDDQSSLVDEGYWHDNGQTSLQCASWHLLEAMTSIFGDFINKRLKRAMELIPDFLLKQLTELRELSQRKAAFVDEADSYNMELDRNNRRLMKQMVADKQKIARSVFAI